MKKLLILLAACMLLLSSAALADELFPAWKANDSTKIKDGVLELTLPKMESAQVHKISVARE